MIEALIGGERDPFVLAGLARGRLRARLDDLPASLRWPVHRRSCPAVPDPLDAYDLLTGQIATLDQLVERAAGPFGAVIARRSPSPGSGRASHR